MESSRIGLKQSICESELTLQILKMLNDTKYELVQENGQRHLTAPEFVPEDRVKGSEVFIGHLPRDCYECELMPMFVKFGLRLLELRLMLDFSASTRGYAFALFENAETARRACQLLDGYEIRSGHRIGVVKSINNCRLFFGGVPKDKTKDEFITELGNILDGITNVYMYPNTINKTQNRGFIFVEFKDHRTAAMARRKLIPGRIVLWNHEIAVDWADPEPNDIIDDTIMQSVSILFVRNICPDVDHRRVREIFQKTTGIQILKLKKINHFAFIHYADRESAQRAMDIMTAPGGQAEHENWEILWSKPIESSKLLDRQRSINEALLNNNNNNNDYQNRKFTTNRKSKSHKKRFEKKSSSISTTSSSTSQTFERLLEVYVIGYMHADCNFECYNLSDDRFICKILITSGTNVIYEFQGVPFDSKELAIEETARALYEHFHRLSDSNEIEKRNILSCNSVNAQNHHVDTSEMYRSSLSTPSY